MTDQAGGPIIVPDANDRDLATIAWASNQDARIFIDFFRMVAPTGAGMRSVHHAWHRVTGDQTTIADLDAPIGEWDFLRLESGREGERDDLVVWCTLGGEVDASDPNAGVMLRIRSIGELSDRLADLIVATSHVPIARERVDAFLAGCADVPDEVRA